MSSVAKVIEISAKSDKSFDDAVKVGVERAAKSVRNVQSAWVKDSRVEVTNGSVSSYQVNLQVTFILDESSSAG